MNNLVAKFYTSPWLFSKNILKVALPGQFLGYWVHTAKLLFSKVGANMLSLSSTAWNSLPFCHLLPPRRARLLETNQNFTWALYCVLICNSFITKGNLGGRYRGFYAPVLLPSSLSFYVFSPGRGTRTGVFSPITGYSALDKPHSSSLTLGLLFCKGNSQCHPSSSQIFVKINICHGHAMALKYYMLFRL